MNQITVMQSNPVATAATAKDMKAQVQRIQEVMKAVMKKDTHFGVIPGTPKPSLWKPGAEVLAATFHIAVSYRVDDLSDSDCVRYRVTAVGTHQATGIVLGEGLGECSSNEEKYKWKKAGDREFEATDGDRKRVKYMRGQNGEYEAKQVRVEPADIANTVLKMACKRAQVAMILNTTAASDCFTQDLEDLPEGMAEDIAAERPASAKANTAPPQSTTNGGGNFANEKQQKLLRVKLDQAGKSSEELCKHFNIDSLTKLPFSSVNDALAWIASNGREPGSDDEA